MAESPQVDVRADDALGDHDVMDLLHLLRKREVSAADLRAAAQSRINAANESLNAVVRPLDLGDAANGPFAGIPTVLKDNEDLEGYPTLHGSWAPADRPAAATSPWVAQYVALGFTPMAKTTLPEFGLTATTESTRYGATRNPWNTGHSTGGSSGGSAALVASGAVPIGHANDGGGSIRIPAALNGLVGLKPSRGRLIDLPELDRLPVNLVTQGVLTRSVRDTAYYFAEAERVYRNPDLPPIGMVVRPERPRLRVGLVTESLAGSPLDPETRDAVLAAGSALQGLGHDVTEVDLGIGQQFGRDFLRYWALLSFMLQRAGSRFIGEGFDGSKTEQLTKGLSAMCLQQAERVPWSLRRLVRASREPEAIYDQVDVVISPVVSHPAPPIGYLGPDVAVRDQLVRLLRFTSFTPLQNVSGAPAISLPLARSSAGLPIGVQVAAAVGQERRLLSMALELEEAMPWPRTPAA